MASMDPSHPPRQIFLSGTAQQPSAPTPPPAVRSLHPSLPLDSDPNPRISAFVKSQQQHSSFYKQEGLALFSGWLDDQRAREAEEVAAKRTPGGKGKEREREKPRAPGNEGIRAVDVLSGLGGASSSSAGLTGKGGGGASSGGSRVRMADRMRGKDGSSKKAGTSTPRKRRNDDDEGEKSGGMPEGSEIVLTRRESEGRALGKEKNKHQVDPCSSSNLLPSTSNHPPPKQPTPSSSSKPLLAEASNAEDRPRDRDGKKRPRLDPVEEAANDDESPPSSAQPSPPPRKSKAISSKPNKIDPPPPPTPKASSSKPKPPSQSKAANKPSKSTGKENLEAEEHAVRLEERKSRRRAKAEIVKPKPTAHHSSSASSSAELVSTDADSRRKTRRVRKRRSGGQDVEEEESEPDEDEGERRKRRKKEKEKSSGKKKKENRDLGASIGMGMGIMDTFKAGNLGGGPSRRLTLKRDVPKPGVFNKGRSSSKVVTKGKKPHEAVGVQDLVFSESRFLSRPRPALTTASSASVDPEPHSRPHRSLKARRPSPPPPTNKKRKSRVLEDSDEVEEEPEDDGPVETVSKFFSASKTKTKSSKDKAKEDQEMNRAEYSPSWPDVGAEDVESRRTSEAARSTHPAASVHSTTRQGNTRSLSSRSIPSHDAASISRSHHPQPQSRPPSSRRPVSSHHSAPDPATSSKRRTSGAPLPSSRSSNSPPQPDIDSVDVLLRACETGELPSPARQGSQQRKLVYGGTSSVGDYDVFVEIEVDGNGLDGGWDPEAEEWRSREGRNEQDVYSPSFDHRSRDIDGPSYDQEDQHQHQQYRGGLSDLGEEADVFRSAGHDFKTESSSRRLHLPSRFDEDPPFGQPPQQQHFEKMEEEEDVPMHDDFRPEDGFSNVGFDRPPFLDDNEYSPPFPQASSSRNRAPFHPSAPSFGRQQSDASRYQQQEEQYFSKGEEEEEEEDRHPQQQTGPFLLSDIADEDEEEEEEIDLRDHWRRQRT